MSGFIVVDIEFINEEVSKNLQWNIDFELS